MGRIITSCLLFFALAQSGWALELYFLRHAETVANATKDYAEANWTNFSENGKQQIASITEKLKTNHFDVILVSPVFRAQKTIFPFLENQGRVAEIWPELEECCWQRRWPRRVSRVSMGPAVSPLDPALFHLRDELQQEYEPRNFAEGIFVLERAAELLKKQYGQSDQTILLVMHHYSGSCLMELLLGLKPKRRFELENAKLSKLVQDEDGSFRLVILNDESYP